MMTKLSTQKTKKYTKKLTQHKHTDPTKPSYLYEMFLCAYGCVQYCCGIQYDTIVCI